MEHGGNLFETASVNVSEGGCAIGWPEALPLVGDLVALKLRSGPFPPTAGPSSGPQAGGAGGRTAGLRVVMQGRAGRAWRALAAEAARRGARAA